MLLNLCMCGNCAKDEYLCGKSDEKLKQGADTNSAAR